MLDMIPNGVYRAELEVETIINKMREGRLRWFGHVRRRPQSAPPVRRVEDLVVDGVRRRGRPKLKWEDRVKHDLKELLLSENMTSDRNEWMARINTKSALSYLTLFELGLSYERLHGVADRLYVPDEKITWRDEYRPGSKDFGLVMSDIQTWVSAALTDEDTCSEGFANDPKMKNVVRGKVVNVVHLTSNALGLINSYDSLHE
ncbi:putative cytochrome P450 [Tanacetum coccineum]